MKVGLKGRERIEPTLKLLKNIKNSERSQEEEPGT